jgi:ferredoxin
MIITKQKDEKELSEMFQPFKKIFIVGCGSCATSCQTGGEKQVAEMKEKYRDKVIGTAMVEEPCDLRLSRRDLKEHRGAIKEADAVLVMSCGSGVQTIGDYTNKIVLPALESLFIGETERLGHYIETCQACGECVLDETGGICPIAKCAKGLLNGPCGGQVKGKCEVGKYENDCAWVNIWKRLKEQNREELFTTFRPPRDYSKKTLTTRVEF